MSYFARNVSSDELGGLLSAIQKSGTKFSNATASYAYPSGWKTELPVSFSPFGKAFVLDSVKDVGGNLALNFFDKPNPKFYESVLKKLSPNSRVSFWVDLHPKDIPFEDLSACLLFENGKVFIGLSGYAPVISNDEFTGVEPLRKVIEMGKLPLTIQKETSGKFTFKHTQAGGELDVPKADRTVESPIYADLPGLSVEEAVAQFHDFIHHPEFQSKGESWRVSWDVKEMKSPKLDSLKLVEAISHFGFPSKKVEVDFEWHLRDYTDFKELARIAKLTGSKFHTGGADAQLLDFEFGEGKTCRLVTECDKKGAFKIWFNTKTDDDLVLLRQFLKKLK